MRAIRVGDVNAHPEITEIQKLDPQANEIGVEVRACGLNFADLLMIRGRYQEKPALPFTPGLEVAGVVTSVGSGVTGFATGDRVAVYAGQGGMAEHGCFDAARATHIPDAMPFDHAAAFPVAYGTSHIALNHCARLQPGETLLVTGAAGGVGLTAVEMGKLMGARVIAQARSADKLAVTKAAGADKLIEGSETLREAVKALGGADVVYDTIGGDVFTAAFRATNPGGRVLPIGFAGGEVPQIPANHLLVKNLTVIGFYIGGYLKHFPQVITDSMAQLFDWYTQGKLSPHIGQTLPLAEYDQGLELLRSRQATGKVIIRPQD